MTAAYRFLPWVRQGVAAAVEQPDPPGADLPGRARLPLDLRVDGGGGARVDVALLGPADVVAIDTGQVLRTDPAPFSLGAETTRFPAVELRTPVLPWAFTPAAADERGRLRPWLCLVVVPAELAAEPVALAPDRPPAVTLPVDELPDLVDSWAWAHAQVVADDADSRLADLLAARPGRAVARLLCPRRLLPGTAYHAFVVPAFDGGRRAGLGLDVDADDEAALRPAWTSGQGTVQLPAYHHWTFETGEGGDFASLAARLQHCPAPAGLGTRHVDVATLVDDRVLPFGGAMRARGGRDDPEDPTLAAARDALRVQLEDVLEDDRGRPLVGPPLYGIWHAGEAGLPDDEEPPRWLRELNLDPRHRAAAALGTLVVRDRQHELMASAWAQVGDVEEASQVLRQGQLAREADRPAHRRLAAMTPGDVLGVTHGVQSRVVWTGGTAWSRLRASPLPAAATSPAMRRLARPGGPLARRTGARGTPLAGAAAAALAAGDLPAVPARTNPDDLDAPEHVLSRGARPDEPADLGDGVDEALAESAAWLSAHLDHTAPGRARAVNPAQIAAGLLTRLDPDHTVTARVRDRLSERRSPRDDATDPLEPVMAAPTFPQPMAEPLHDIAPDAFLPGLDRLPDDSVTLLETDPAFVEAFLVGLNHEMGRELRWRGYPTDQRGTYFPSFWGGTWLERGREREIHRWGRGEALGANHPEAGGADGLLVLVLRGELLRRYPDARLYATRAVVRDGVRVPGRQERHARFDGRVEPDVTFAGFPLRPDEARSGEGDQGWFFVVEQPAGDPGFGLDPSTEPGDLDSWTGLRWGHLTEDGADAPPTYAHAGGPPAGVPLEGLEWGLNAAHMARITLRTPVRVAIHADDLLPGDG